ncbi:hypothetical protein [uncultured Psychrobacter sp.]|uniref:hypothetical protein n=1 Tax=uncultured Psychrobacter sp. TaxID=259303 RepID=UPI0030D92D71
MPLKSIKNSSDITLSFTDTAGGYREETSCNSGLDDSLWQKLVPQSGRASTIHGEVLRGASRIYRDAYQNGGGNIVEFEDDGYSCDHCGFYDEDEDERGDHEDQCDGGWVISDNYKELFDILDKELPKEGRDVLAKVRKEVLDGIIGMPSIAFDHLVDHAIHLILTTEDEPLKQKQGMSA